MHKVSLAITALLAFALGCDRAPRAREGTPDRLQTEYDDSGKLTRLTYDRDGDGKTDAWGFMDGSRVVRVEVDENGDGTPDTWEYHSATVAGGRAAGGTDRTVQRVERATQFDGRVTRREYFDGGVLTRVQEDTDGDGKDDKWETYVNGALATMALDTSGRGTPDRRFVYAADGELLRIEADAAGDGTFRPLPTSR